jgi:hypothetical protein
MRKNKMYEQTRKVVKQQTFYSFSSSNDLRILFFESVLFLLEKKRKCVVCCGVSERERELATKHIPHSLSFYFATSRFSLFFM